MAAHYVDDGVLAGGRLAEPVDRLDGADANAGRLILLQAVDRAFEEPRAHFWRQYFGVPTAKTQTTAEK